MMIPFNKPFMTGKEIDFIADAHAKRHLSGGGYYTNKCNEWMKSVAKVDQALLTHSCTAALEMAAILLDIMPGDEIIMPSYTFVSIANAFVLRGAVLVFVDIRQDTLNMDEKAILSQNIY
jgi:dTDP-4-amino-4,6-dideoxygalactose transaminase